METLKLEIITPEHKFLEEQAEIVIIPGAEGELGILSQHVPLITALKPGIIKLKKSENSTYDEVFVTAGFAEVSHNEVVILTEMACYISELKEEEIIQSKEICKERLSKCETEIEKNFLQDSIDTKDMILEIISSRTK